MYQLSLNYSIFLIRKKLPVLLERGETMLKGFCFPKSDEKNFHNYGKHESKHQNCLSNIHSSASHGQFCENKTNHPCSCNIVPCALRRPFYILHKKCLI